jgi:hypothetical protein
VTIVPDRPESGGLAEGFTDSGGKRKIIQGVIELRFDYWEAFVDK